MFATVPARSEGRIAIVTDVGRDAVDAIAAQTTDAGADGQAVWSWRSEAGAKSAMMLRITPSDGGNQAMVPGESAE